MVSKPKYTGARKVRKVVLGHDFFAKLEAEGKDVVDIVMNNLEDMKNEINGHTHLAFAFNSDKARFVVFKFIELNPREIKLYEYEDISSDRYLDMLLEERVLITKISEDIPIDY